ncbi:hypothetical protein JNK13_05075 [bacterium]|nr:hypothetical protein [bacterium]
MAITANTERDKVKNALVRLLKPVARLAIRYGLSLQEITDGLKQVLVELASEELKIKGAPVNSSRISAMTGVHRKDVTKLRAGEATTPRIDLKTRIIGQWLQGKSFRTSSGRPRVLRIAGSGDLGEFAKLVNSVSSDLNPATVLSELERLGAVKKTTQGLKLNTRLYLAQGDLEAGLKMLANDIEDLSRSVEENLTSKNQIPNLHLKTEYDNITPESLKTIRSWFFREGSAFHQRARNFLSRFDRDLVESKNSQRVFKHSRKVRVAIGSFSLIEGEPVCE